MVCLILDIVKILRDNNRTPVQEYILTKEGTKTVASNRFVYLTIEHGDGVDQFDVFASARVKADAAGPKRYFELTFRIWPFRTDSQRE